MTQGEWIMTALAVLSALGHASTGWFILTGRAGKRDVGPQPFEVKATVIYASKEDHDRLARKVEVLEKEVRINHAEALQKGEERAQRIETTIRDSLMELANKVGELRGEIKRIH